MTAQLDRNAYETAERLLRHDRRSLVFGAKARPQWIDEGARFWYAVDTARGRRFVLVDPAAGTREPAFDAHWRCDLDSYACEKVDGHRPRTFLEVASPDGKKVVFRRSHDLGVRSEYGDERPLTSDGAPDHDYRTSPFTPSVLLSEVGLPHLRPAVAWSPDSTPVLTHRIDQRDRHLHDLEPPAGDRRSPATFDFDALADVFS